MPRSFRMRPALWSTATLLAAMWLLGMAIGAGTAHAQEDGPPPLPLLFEGNVLLDGEPVASGTLTVRVGDWEGDAVPVVGGSFTCANPCLIAGPPSQRYIGELVTFHLDGGGPASYSFPFPNAGLPSRTHVDLFFGLAPMPSPVATPTAIPTPTATVGTGLPTVSPTIAVSDAPLANRTESRSAVVVVAAVAAAVALAGGGALWLRRRRRG